MRSAGQNVGVSPLGLGGLAIWVTVALSVGAVVGCQAWDRLEPPEEGDGEALGAPSSLSSGVAQGSPAGQRSELTSEIASRWLAQIEEASAEQRVALIEQFTGDFPQARLIYPLALLEGEARTQLGDPAGSAEAYERAVLLSGGRDLLELPHDADIAYRLGWARYQAGDREAGIELLVRTTTISDRPQLEEGLRYLFAEQGGDPSGFDEWLASRQAQLSVKVPDFELPGYQQESVRLGEVLGRITLLCFWSPT